MSSYLFGEHGGRVAYDPLAQPGWWLDPTAQPPIVRGRLAPGQPASEPVVSGYDDTPLLLRGVLFDPDPDGSVRAGMEMTEYTGTMTPNGHMAYWRRDSELATLDPAERTKMLQGHGAELDRRKDRVQQLLREIQEDQESADLAELIRDYFGPLEEDRPDHDDYVLPAVKGAEFTDPVLAALRRLSAKNRTIFYEANPHLAPNGSTQGSKGKNANAASPEELAEELADLLILEEPADFAGKRAGRLARIPRIGRLLSWLPGQKPRQPGGYWKFVIPSQEKSNQETAVWIQQPVEPLPELQSKDPEGSPNSPLVALGYNHPILRAAAMLATKRHVDQLLEESVHGDALAEDKELEAVGSPQ